LAQEGLWLKIQIQARQLIAYLPVLIRLS